ncbi:hypothetical protein, partial [Moraxella sp. K127]|uniref:hypothetical protein n=1 Tax=Moraxella sp. K127 TaxID=2780079 RepID=UPI001D10891A
AIRPKINTLSKGKCTPSQLDICHGFAGVLSTPFDDITTQGVHSTPLHPNIIVFAVILKFLGCL